MNLKFILFHFFYQHDIYIIMDIGELVVISLAYWSHPKLYGLLINESNVFMIAG